VQRHRVPAALIGAVELAPDDPEQRQPDCDDAARQQPRRGLRTEHIEARAVHAQLGKHERDDEDQRSSLRSIAPPRVSRAITRIGWTSGRASSTPMLRKRNPRVTGTRHLRETVRSDREPPW
jgi:hypothetical protein